MSQSDVCAVVLLDSAGRALLQLRDEKPGLRASGQWVFPGGHVEADESLEAGARREFEEETCYRCGGLVWVLSLQDVHYPGWSDYQLHVFYADFDGYQKYRCREGRDLRFVSLAEASGLPVPPYQKKIWEIVLGAREGLRAKLITTTSSTVPAPNA